MNNNLLENERLLNQFFESLEESKLSEKVISKHMNHIEFFLNDYLDISENTPANMGIDFIGEFLGSWFIKKAMWSTETTIKENITSLKKFYKFMLNNSEIESDDYQKMLYDIKKDKSKWIKACNVYNDYDEGFGYDDVSGLSSEIFDELISLLSTTEFVLDPVVKLTYNNDSYYVMMKNQIENVLDISFFKGSKGLNCFMKAISGIYVSPHEFEAEFEGYTCHYADYEEFVMYSEYGNEIDISVEYELINHLIELLTLFIKKEPDFAKQLNGEDKIISISNHDNQLSVKTENINDIYLKASNHDKDSSLNELEIKRIKKMRKTDQVWEMEQFFLPSIEEWDEFGRLITIIDQEGGQCLNSLPIENDENLKMVVLSAFEQYGVPQKILLNPSWAEDSLQLIIKESCIDYEIAVLEEMKEFKQVFFERLFEMADNDDFFDETELFSPNEMAIDLLIEDKPSYALKACLKKYSFKQLIDIGSVFHKTPHSTSKENLINAIYSGIISVDLEMIIGTFSMEEQDFLNELAQVKVLVSDERLVDKAENACEKALVVEFFHEGHYKYVMPSETRKKYSQINQNQLKEFSSFYWLVKRFFVACINLYGIIEVDKAVMFLADYFEDEKDVILKDYSLIAELLRLDKDINFEGAYLVHEILEDDKTKQEILLNDKPYFKPPLNEFLNYDEEFFCENNTHELKMQTFLIDKLGCEAEEAEEIFFDIQTCIQDGNMDELFMLLEYHHVEMNSQKEFDKFMKLYTQLSNHTRLWINHGFTPSEMSQMQVGHVKIGRNQPCPCGSGKKYKKCCGK
ncbi:MAG: SEC-C domain-containing protein [Clostridiales bacterium]|nr:SEC-C domain-containing protein [Clostridiales bacterium]